MNWALLLLLFTTLLQMKTECGERSVEVEPQKVMLKEGQNFAAKCRVNHPSADCIWYKRIGSHDWHIPNRYTTRSESYFQKETGECRIIIQHITEMYNGIITCRFLDEKEKVQNEGNVTLVVVKPPTVVQMNVIGNGDNPKDTFTENQTIQVECKIEFGRPEAKIFWYIGIDPIYNGLSNTTVEDIGPPYDEEKRMRQNLTKMLTYSDNGKDLKCVANHSALGQATLLLSIFKLNVHFKPKFEDSQKCLFTVGKSEKIVVTIHANPKPQITWLVDNVTLPEGSRDETGRFHAIHLMNEGQDKWQAILNITKVKPEDIGKNYSLTARNELEVIGFIPKISAFAAPSVAVASSSEILVCPAPSTVVAAWWIAGTVVTILLIILIGLKLNICRTRRWSFSKPKTKKMEIKYAAEYEIEEFEEMCTEL